MGLTWLITGGCGFIGTSLINTLIKEGGHKIRIIDNLSVGSRNDLAAVTEFTKID
ncbi:MAG: NAD-dependent epimerase/dehydratase family protein [Pseudomonadota bacterium]